MCNIGAFQVSQTFDFLPRCIQDMVVQRFLPIQQFAIF